MREGLLFVAKRRFDPSARDEWKRYISWSGLGQLREIVSLDEMLCPTFPEEPTTDDWEHNVHADYLTTYFRSLQYLRHRVAQERNLNILAVFQNPSPEDLKQVDLPDFRLAGFDVMDVHGDISALTNCGGFDDVFRKSEISRLGLLEDLSRAYQVQSGLKAAYPDEPHAQCHVWAIWRAVD